MYLDFLSAIVSQNWLNPIMQRAKNDRSALRALPVYDNDNDEAWPLVQRIGWRVVGIGDGVVGSSRI